LKVKEDFSVVESSSSSSFPSSRSLRLFLKVHHCANLIQIKVGMNMMFLVAIRLELLVLFQKVFVHQMLRITHRN